MVPLRRHAAKSEGQSESRRSMLGMLPIELERVLCFGPRKLTMVWGPKGVASQCQCVVTNPRARSFAAA